MVKARLRPAEGSSATEKFVIGFEYAHKLLKKVRKLENKSKFLAINMRIS
jgi:hypothetical protein